MKVLPRKTPDRDSRYMGLAWMHASFSKDPSTQVGSVVVSEDNKPLGSGYNGPPSVMDDDEVDWSRPPENDPEAFSKYDVIVHAEQNAIDHSCGSICGATIYVTAMPCPNCMKEIVRKQVARVVYFDYQSSSASSLQNQKWRAKSLEIARRGKVKVDKFEGDLNWLLDWTRKMKDISVFKIPE
jgi:dCMP deaminase